MWKATLYDTTKVTIELRDIVNNGTNIWDFDYPSYYQGEQKTAFEQKVIDHYYLRQIGSETVGRFLHQFRTRIREIMPRYLEMYKTVELMNNLDNPFDNVDIVETFEQENEGSSTGTSKEFITQDGENNNEHRFSDTPQNSVGNIYYTHLTEASTDETNASSHSTTDVDSSSTSSGKTTHTLTRKGNQGINTYAHDIIEYRKSIIDVDMMIIEDLNDLFLLVY